MGSGLHTAINFSKSTSLVPGGISVSLLPIILLLIVNLLLLGLIS